MCNELAPPDYEAEVQALAKVNARYVGVRLSNRDAGLLNSIRTWADRFGYSQSEIEDKIRSDPIFAAVFAHEPSRQRVHEQIAADWITGLETVDGLERLARSGSDALYVLEQGTIGYSPSWRAARALNFMWTTGTTEFFGLHTYTRQSGGSQTSRVRELAQALEYFQLGAERSEVALVLITDGSYYTTEMLDELRTFTRTEPPLSYVCRLEELPAILARHAYPE